MRMPAVAPSIPAPVGGWNVRVAKDLLKPTEAYVLDNWYPDGDKVIPRPGYKVHATAGTGLVKTVIGHVGGNVEKLLAGGSGHIWDATTAGSATSLASGFQNDRWQTENFNDHTFLVNGEDAPHTYNGSTLSASGFTGTGLTVSNLINVGYAKNRLWFCEKDMAQVWYAGVSSITGTLTKFDLSQICRGGYCMAVGNWSRDAGDGMDDYTVFVMSTGEIIIYAGDPATSFSKIGQYQAAEPLGRQCLIKHGGELILALKTGYFGLSSIMQGAMQDEMALSANISPAVRDAAKLYGANEAWQIARSPNGNQILVNIPTRDGASSDQHVYNAITGAWTRFKDMPVTSMACCGDDLFFSGWEVEPTEWGSPWGSEWTKGGIVYKQGGGSDNGMSIRAVSKGAFSYFGDRSTSKRFTAVRPQIAANDEVLASLGVNVDFSDREFPWGNAQLSRAGGGANWGDDWGSQWRSKPTPHNKWIGAKGFGRSAGVHMEIRTKAEDVQWFSTDIMTKQGRIG